MKEYRITDSTGASAVILPEKGATVISYCVDGKEYFYRDQANLDSPERPRCGIPFLFPAFGRTAEGSEYPLEIHGFGHTSAWTVEDYHGSELRLSLQDNEDTFKVYPYHFRVELTFALRAGILSIHQKYENHGGEAMLYAFGFHPYFAVEDAQTAQITVNAGLEMDMLTGKPMPCTKNPVTLLFPEGAAETGAFFLQARDFAVIDAGSGKRIRMEFDESFDRLVLWSVKGKGFVCVEPINSSPNGLTTGDCYFLAPGECKEAVVSFRGCLKYNRNEVWQ